MPETIYVKGFRTFPPRQGAPDSVLGDLIVSIDEFAAFVESQKEHITEYNGKKQLRLSQLKAKDGSIIYKVNTYKPNNQQQSNQQQDNGSGLPF